MKEDQNYDDKEFAFKPELFAAKQKVKPGPAKNKEKAKPPKPELINNENSPPKPELINNDDAPPKPELAENEDKPPKPELYKTENGEEAKVYEGNYGPDHGKYQRPMPGKAASSGMVPMTPEQIVEYLEDELRKTNRMLEEFMHVEDRVSTCFVYCGFEFQVSASILSTLLCIYICLF